MKYQSTIQGLQTYIIENNLREIQLSDAEDTSFTLLGGQELTVAPEVVRYLASKSYIEKKHKDAPCDTAIYAINGINAWVLSVDVDD